MGVGQDRGAPQHADMFREIAGILQEPISGRKPRWQNLWWEGTKEARASLPGLHELRHLLASIKLLESYCPVGVSCSLNTSLYLVVPGFHIYR
jgi:hypothetical protein